MRDKTVEDAMTPLESVFMLNINSIIDRETMKDVSCRIVCGVVYVITGGL